MTTNLSVTSTPPSENERLIDTRNNVDQNEEGEAQVMYQPKSYLCRSRRRRRSHPAISPLLLAVILLILILGFVSLLPSETSSIIPTSVESAVSPDTVPLLGSARHKQSDQEEDSNDCVSMCIGAFAITCMANGNPHLDFTDGIFDGYVISLANDKGGIEYYMLSIDSEYLGMTTYLEYGEYTLDTSITTTSTATQNCAGHLDFFALDKDNNFQSMQFDLEWNGVDDSFLLFSKTGFGCHYQRIYGNQCRQALHDITKAYHKQDMTIPAEEDGICNY